MHTLIPSEVSAPAHPLGRGGRILGFGLTRRALLLLHGGFLLSIPAFFHPHRIWMMFAWDGLLLLFAAIEVFSLPSPHHLQATRRFLDSPRLGQPTRVELEIAQQGSRILEIDVTDGLHAALMPLPQTQRVEAYPRDPVRTELICFPGVRGDLKLGDVFLRYRGMAKLVERWAVCPMPQEVRVFPAFDTSGEDASLYLMRVRQLEMQRRKIKLRGTGREFESMRDYVGGDELRNLSWTATARRGKLITRQFTTERSQQVWVVLDAGRLSRTAFALQRSAVRLEHEAEHESAQKLLLTVTQLDQAASAAVMVGEAVSGSGDKCGLLTYGRRIQQQLLPGSGAAHLRIMIDQLAQVRGEAAEANHLQAASRLRQLQRRRGLIIWITEIADSAGRPEIVTAAAELVRTHLVLLVLLEHPELEELAGRTVKTVEEMYSSAAATEMLNRRRETIATLRRQGVLVVESTPGNVGIRAINSYLDVKARGLL
jgi:uncharacterized protein (DUF58 family)